MKSEDLETIEHLVTVIGIEATWGEDNKWFTKESYKDAIKYTKEFVEEREDRVRSEMLDDWFKEMAYSVSKAKALAKQDLKQKLIGEVAKERKSNDKRYKSGYYQWNKEGYFATIQTLDEVLDIIGKI